MLYDDVYSLSLYNAFLINNVHTNLTRIGETTELEFNTQSLLVDRLE